jgi:chemotaxis family two-component system sensor histidine kinase/response regulator PixL
MTLDPNYQAQLHYHFSLEAPELLNTIEQALFNLQEEKTNLEQVRILMRATHTLKSIAATLKLETIKNIAHGLEDVFRAIQQPDLVITQEMKALFLEGYECLRVPLMAELNGSIVDDKKIVECSSVVLSRLQEKLGSFREEESQNLTLTEVSFESIQMLFETTIGPELEKAEKKIINAEPKETATILRRLAELFLGYAQALRIPGFLAITQTTIAALDNHPEQVHIIAKAALEDFYSCHAGILSGESPQGGHPSVTLRQFAGWEFSSNTDPGIAKSQTSSSIDSIAHRENSQSQKEPLPAALGVDSPTIVFPKIVRVNVEHLEQLNYLNAELLTNQNRQFLQNGKKRSFVRKLLSRLGQLQQMLSHLQDWSNPLLLLHETHQKHSSTSNNLASFDDLELNSYSQFHIFIQTLLEETASLEQEIDTLEQLNRQTTQLLKKQQKLLTNSRDVLLDARMMPLGSILNRLYPVLEQLQILYSKPINFTIKGNDVLVDKAIAERLYEPLLHLVRNAFDHGIESAEIRQLHGKLPQGQIEIRAYYQGSQLNIDVQDDGQGLNFDAIRQQAIQRGLTTTEAANLKTESELAELLFESGFSTAPQVNELSGRGVGLDVVKVQLQSIQGVVAVHTEAQKGTTFSLQIPLTLSINKLLVCQAGEKAYALAADTIEQILLPKKGQISYSEHGRVLRLAHTLFPNQPEAGEIIPIYRLEEILDYSSSQPIQISQKSLNYDLNSNLPLLVVLGEEQLLALEVDRIIWEQELVIRPLSKLVPTPTYVYGGTILPDGGLTLVINAANLLEHNLHQEMQVMERYKKHISPATNSTALLPTTSRTKPALLREIQKPQPTVMIVDDSITIRQALVFTLQTAGYKILQARDGYEAIARIQANAEIDLIICDIEMPRMNGFEFLAHCKSDECLSQIPIIILSSRTAVKHRHLALKLGAAMYLTKPYSEQQLLSTVSQILNDSEFGIRNC